MRRVVPAVATLALTLAITATATADPQTVPNGPWVQDSQQVRLERLHSYDEMVKALRQISQRSGGRVALETIGQSNEGRDLYLAKAGTGPTKVLYVTQQHGNEPLGTEAALQLLQRVANGGAGWDAILDKVTLLVVPKVNPDGSERFQRQNHDPDCSGAFCTPGVGFDVNRWHDPAVAPEANPVPEAAAIQRVAIRYQPDLVVDFHHQGSYVTDDGDLITTSIFWPNHPDAPASAVTLSKQMCVVINDTLSRYGFAEVSQYPGTLPRGIARNSYGIRGAGSALVELRGGIGQKSSGMLVRTAFATMGAVLEAAAEDTIDTQDPARADAIPLRGDFVEAPHE
ncbi:M14 family zinc carboxypeptidase [Nocardioides speluncae]|uniref:M14 family zinc carboxypeptidase n=1 Tax=Nocardioides speluncae TaxID=2670337 RepID=UPI00137A68A7|nr:M14 family zinc carboxypeptidase [Nocardioides speluncae]